MSFRSVPLRAPVFRRLALGAAMVGLAAGQEFPGAPSGGDDDMGGIFSGGMLRDGSILTGVTLPTYSADLSLESSVKAKKLTVRTKQVSRTDKKTGKVKEGQGLDYIDAEEVSIRFFDPDRSLKGRIQMEVARLEARPKMLLLLSTRPVRVDSDTFDIQGSGLAYDTNQNRGFLNGPVDARGIITDRSTTMNLPSTRSMIAAGSLMAAAQAAPPAEAVAPPPTAVQRMQQAKLTDAELAEVAALKTSATPKLEEQKAKVEANRKSVVDASKLADSAVAAFLRTAAIATPAPAGNEKPAAGDESLPDVPRPEIFSNPPGDEVQVKSRDGAYFDTAEGLVVFLGAVTVNHPEFNMKGAEEIKIFMEPAAKEEGKKETAKPGPKIELTPEMLEKMKQAKLDRIKTDLTKGAAKDKGSAGGDFGDIKRLVATGPAVHIRVSRQDEAPIEASAHTLIYDFEKQQILLQGGSPWVIQEGDGGFRGQAKGPEAYIVIEVDEENELQKISVVNQGGGNEMNFKPPQDNKKTAPKPKSGGSR